MTEIKIWFTDFYQGFDARNNPFTNLLSEHYKIILDKNSPDFLFFSCYGHDFLNYDCVRIFYTGENIRPDFNLSDYAIGFDYLQYEDRYLRFPNFALFEGQFEELKRETTYTPKLEKEFFCNFIYSNHQANPVRDQFFQALNDYKPITSPGTHLNNSKISIGGRFSENWMFDKIEFQSKCKFTIAFENSSSPGYTTEKIMHAFVAGSIPIYWGDPKVTADFNKEAFINVHDFENLSEVVNRVIEIDQNAEAFQDMLAQPPFRRNKIPSNLKMERLTEFLTYILDQDRKVATRRPKFGTTPNYEQKLKGLFSTKNSKGWKRLFKS
ncbi:glycosyltransferase family 10 [Gramella sp. GC03-9]|uniref:Glycosyltransferase family 10 n=1 Tax=Christiangramia oceanisediminis TaxID=2920386 RepID=A0A9X2I5P1_9FLAO|nr:glycosyltransferase family 10 [Gramella oceanisediminis]MCP9199877.1 glycosyltransferase family 10 [Gramella oceanisediminis]